MNTIYKTSLLVVLAALAATAAQAKDYWFVSTNGNTDFTNINNWRASWDGATPLGDTPATTTEDPRIQFQSTTLNIDAPVEIGATTVFYADKTVSVSGSPITIKNIKKTDSNNNEYITNYVTLVNQATWGTSGGGKITINSDLILKSISTTTAVNYTVACGNQNNLTINGDISLQADSIDGAMTKFNDDTLKVSWVTTNSAYGVGTGNVFLNGAINLGHNVGTWTSYGRLNIGGRSSSAKAFENPYAVLGGSSANNISSIKIFDSANIVLAKDNNVMAGTLIESRGNNLVTFMHDQQIDNSQYMRVMDSRTNVNFNGDTKWAHTALALRINGTNQEAAYANIEWDQWGSSNIEEGAYQYLQVDFAKGYNSELGVNETPSILTFNDGDKAIALDRNLAITSAGVKLETDVAKAANRENAIKSGIILVNYDYENGDRIYFNSDKVLLADSKYYDDISKISTDVIDHIWLDEGVKDVDYKLSLELDDRYYTVVVTTIPEPATFAAILGLGAIAIATRGLRRKN